MKKNRMKIKRETKAEYGMPPRPLSTPKSRGVNKLPPPPKPIAPPRPQPKPKKANHERN
ncbi:MAG TPA: hypothetical protein VN922_04705 [Bacteroidia bacterium]|nr:hypothetical protein [Bacteroidia bacterium]